MQSVGSFQHLARAPRDSGVVDGMQREVVPPNGNDEGTGNLRAPGSLRHLRTEFALAMDNVVEFGEDLSDLPRMPTGECHAASIE